ncbi:hypothetical protein ACLOJK_038797 [Asimina triloba]
MASKQRALRGAQTQFTAASLPSQQLAYVHSSKIRCWQQQKRPAADTAARGATVAGRRHRDGARPATGSHNPQAVRFSYIILIENSAAPPL